MDIELAKKIMKAGLGKAELELVTSFSIPLFWPERRGTELRIKNGTAFALNAGQGTFGVTAAHVINGWRETASQQASPLRLAGLSSLQLQDMNTRLIDEDVSIDIATFRLSDTEVASLGKTVLTGSQSTWPPGPPQRERGVLIGGYPGRETIILKPNEVSFAAAPGGMIAHSINELDVSCVFERSEMIGILGQGLPPEDFDFRGMSGGPMLTIIEKAGVRSWALAGVIYQGPNPEPDADATAIQGVEIIKARRAHFLLPDGRLDKTRWHTLNLNARKD
jgi:hypothetical protein